MNSVGSGAEASVTATPNKIVPSGGTILLPGGIELRFRDGATIAPDGTITFLSGDRGAIELPGGVVVELPNGAAINEETGVITMPPASKLITSDGNVGIGIEGDVKVESDDWITLLGEVEIIVGKTTIMLLDGGVIAESSEDPFNESIQESLGQSSLFTAESDDLYFFIYVGK